MNGFWDLINPLVQSPRCELFAREKHDGWMVWGDEVESDFDGSIILKSI
jgi:N6-adenosine-specific RNA methylase IME4